MRICSRVIVVEQELSSEPCQLKCYKMDTGHYFLMKLTNE